MPDIEGIFVSCLFLYARKCVETVIDMQKGMTVYKGLGDERYPE